MKKKKTRRIWSIVVICIAVTALFGLTISGAFFSDSKAGIITGNMGSVKVIGSGGAGTNSLDFAFANLLPGEKQTATANYQNTGTGAEDIWLVFPNKTALSALNSLGTYGEVHISVGGNEIFASVNLNDHPVDQGSNCKGVPQRIKVAENVAPGSGGTISFVFNYASKLEGGNGSGAAWNIYPVVKSTNITPGGYPTNDGPLPGYDQYYVGSGDGSGSGLPYQIVSTQVGQTP